MTGIYIIENLINKKVYIGQSVDINTRWYGHIHSLEKGEHSNEHLQNSWNKYGSEAFVFSVLEECEEDKLTEREQYWIDYYGGINSSNTYNNREAGNKGHLSTATKEKLKEINLGKSPWNKGLTADTDDRVKQYANSLKSHNISEEMKLQISNTVSLRHKEGYYDYEEMTKKRIETWKKNNTIRKDCGVKRGKREDWVGKRISEGKLQANEKKKELGLPLRNQKKKPIPMKTSVCTVCGKEFQQRRCHYKKTCSDECRRKQTAITWKENNSGKKDISSKVSSD